MLSNLLTSAKKSNQLRVVKGFSAFSGSWFLEFVLSRIEIEVFPCLLFALLILLALIKENASGCPLPWSNAILTAEK